MRTPRKVKFKVGQIIQNKKTKSIYVVIPNSGSCEQSTQKRLSEITQDYEVWKVKRQKVLYV